MRRFLLVLGAAVIATATFAGVANATGDRSCVTAAEATYQHELDGPAGHVTITSAQALCEGEEQAFSLVSYTMPRFVHDADNAWLAHDRRSVTLDVDVPGCATEVAAILGTAVDGTGRELARFSGGTGECAPRPSVTFQSYCEGVLHTRLANAAGANVDAVFVVDGKRIRVRPGRHTDLASRPSGEVRVEDSTGAVRTAAWAQPSDCATASSPTSTPPGTVSPA